jgi:hypothetical protein
MKPYLCPICNGHGIVPGGFYTASLKSQKNTVAVVIKGPPVFIVRNYLLESILEGKYNEF